MPPDPTPTTPAPPLRTDAFATEGGTVVASCRGARLTLEAITVRDGWSFDQRTAGRSDQVSVTFTDSTTGSVVTIEISCVGGRPAQTGTRTSGGAARDNAPAGR